MSTRKTQRLTVTEVRDAFRLVGECRDLGADPDAWRGHLANRVGGLVGALVNSVGESLAPHDDGTPGDVLHAADRGWPSDQARQLFLGYMATAQYKKDGVYKTMQRLAMRVGTCSRDQGITDREFRVWPHFNEAMRGCEVGEFLLSFCDLPGGRRQNMIMSHRARGEPMFERRERRIMRLLHEEIGRHLGAGLVTLNDPNPAGLTPRLRQTLRCLLEGDSEKQVANRLGLSTLTIHDYVKVIYRHFRVGSRPELMAYFLQRSRLRPRRPGDE